MDMHEAFQKSKKGIAYRISDYGIRYVYNGVVVRSNKHQFEVINPEKYVGYKDWKSGDY